jgi:hypothetical protein
VRPPSQSDSRVAKRGHFTVPVSSLLRGDRFEGRMQDGTVTTESSHGRMGSATVHRPGAIPDWVQVYTLCRVVRFIAIAASSDMDMSPDSFVLMFWDFYLPPIDECMVSRGCSW